MHTSTHTQATHTPGPWNVEIYSDGKLAIAAQDIPCPGGDAAE